MYRYNLFDNYKITQTQHGYKNKSFHTGKIDFGTKSLNYIYDCGLNRNELRKYFSEHNEKIDLIYVSHYDLDHLSGIINLFNMSEFSSLLSSTKVILPYFNDEVIFFPILFKQENELNDGFSENESISDMLTVPHHGSASSFNQKLLNYTNCYFIITENDRAKKDAMLEDNTSDKILLVNDEQGFELETISNNIDFRSRLKRIGV